MMVLGLTIVIIGFVCWTCVSSGSKKDCDEKIMKLLKENRKGMENDGFETEI